MATVTGIARPAVPWSSVSIRASAAMRLSIGGWVENRFISESLAPTGKM